MSSSVADQPINQEIQVMYDSAELLGGLLVAMTLLYGPPM
jgi:hypothetical protein